MKIILPKWIVDRHAVGNVWPPKCQEASSPPWAPRCLGWFQQNGMKMWKNYHSRLGVLTNMGQKMSDLRHELPWKGALHFAPSFFWVAIFLTSQFLFAGDGDFHFDLGRWYPFKLIWEMTPCVSGLLLFGLCQANTSSIHAKAADKIIEVGEGVSYLRMGSCFSWCKKHGRVLESRYFLKFLELPRFWWVGTLTAVPKKPHPQAVLKGDAALPPAAAPPAAPPPASVLPTPARKRATKRQRPNALARWPVERVYGMSNMLKLTGPWGTNLVRPQVPAPLWVHDFLFSCLVGYDSNQVEYFQNHGNRWKMTDTSACKRKIILFVMIEPVLNPWELWEGDNGISCCSVVRQGASQKLGMRKISCFKLAAATLVVMRLVTGMNAGYIDILHMKFVAIFFWSTAFPKRKRGIANRNQFCPAMKQFDFAEFPKPSTRCVNCTKLPQGLSKPQATGFLQQPTGGKDVKNMEVIVGYRKYWCSYT